MERNAILVDYEWCTGCHSCELACQTEHQLPVGQWGVKVFEIGPYPYEVDGNTKWQFSYDIAFTDQCDLCASRVKAGKKPTCVKHCQAAVMEFGPLSELAKKAGSKSHMALYIPC